MMNDSTKGELGYDPSDQSSFPYQADDPPFGPHRLVLEDLDRAACCDVFEVINTFDVYDNDGPSQFRTLDMALRLFVALTKDTAYDGLTYPDLFGAALDQAMIWENG